MRIIIKPNAEKSIASIGKYISQKGYPHNAEKYIDRMNHFALSLAVFPNKFPFVV